MRACGVRYTCWDTPRPRSQHIWSPRTPAHNRMIFFRRQRLRFILVPTTLFSLTAFYLLLQYQYQIKNALSYATRPLWDTADGPKIIIPHYYAFGMKMDSHACQLHGWTQRDGQKTVKLLDAILMSTELDLLEIRMNELDTIVDNFLIIESNGTFTGLPKETYFANNRARFSKFEKKIVYRL